MITALVIALAIATPATHVAEPDPPNRTGCCVSFDDSPPTVVFCMSDGACRLTGPKA